MTFKILKVNHYQQLTKVLPTKLTIRPGIINTKLETFLKNAKFAQLDRGGAKDC